MRLPKRLQHGDTAELVEHLGELRGRLVVSLSALALGTGVAFIFRDHLIHWLNAPLDGRKPITLNVAEPFTTSLKVSLMAGFALALPVILWQVWAFLSPDDRARRAALDCRPGRPRERTAGRRRGVRLLRRTAGGSRVPHELRLEPLRHPDPREHATTHSRSSCSPQSGSCSSSRSSSSRSSA